jgi:colanic acid biosynthesis glycosyl transferase WcaI
MINNTTEHILALPRPVKHLLVLGVDALLASFKDEPIFSMTIPGKLQPYLSAGKPILAMINGEGARVVGESAYGLTCSASNSQSLADAVLRLSAMSSEKREDMGMKGLEYSKREFDRSNLISKLELMFDKLIITQPSNEV